MWSLKTFFFLFGDHQISTWKTVRISVKTFFFFISGDHLISTVLSIRISVQTFFFWRSHHFSDQTTAFFPSILDFTKPEIRRIWTGPGPTFGPRRHWSPSALILTQTQILTSALFLWEQFYNTTPRFIFVRNLRTMPALAAWKNN